jgi:hypothetical protein
MMWPIYHSEIPRRALMRLGEHTNFVACSFAGISEPRQGCLLAITTSVRDLFLNIIAIRDTHSLEVGGVLLSSVVGGIS